MNKTSFYLLGLYLWSLCIVFSSCNRNENIRSTQPDVSAISGDTVRFAKGFQIETHSDYILATILDPWNPQRILQRYVLVPKTQALPASLPEGILIRTPLERTVSYGSVQCSFFAEFGALSTLVGVCEPQYINIPSIREQVSAGNLADLGQADNPDIEKILLIEPEALFTTPIENAGYGQSAKLGIPLVECVDYMESSPLGRAEWIRFLALFFDKKETADSLFRQTVDNYTQLKELSSKVEHRPTVFTELMYNGRWYVPGGNSYIAYLFRDAGADYIWKEDTSTGSIGLSFESVLDKAESADFWLIKYNSPHSLASGELLQNNPNYAFFDAFKRKSIYTCNTGQTPYYEELPIHPDFILRDMVRIFHPELLPEYRLKYYERMRE
jgi:iron complex transport system substrate-binding protein